MDLFDSFRSRRAAEQLHTTERASRASLHFTVHTDPDYPHTHTVSLPAGSTCGDGLSWLLLLLFPFHPTTFHLRLLLLLSE